MYAMRYLLNYFYLEKSICYCSQSAFADCNVGSYVGMLALDTF